MTPTAELQRRVLALAGAFVALMLSGAAPARADSVVVFNEIQYHPWDPAGAEWIEFHNQMALDVDLSGWRLTGGANFDFPSGTVIPAGGYLIVSGDPAAVGFGSLGPWVGSLSNAGERLRLRNNSGRLMDEVDYGDRGVWPIGPDGSGATLAKADEDTASGVPASWRASVEVGGTPAATNFPDGSGLGPEIVILPIDSTWRYNESGVELAAGWANTAHAVGAGGWLSGPALLGFETAGLPEALQTPFADTSTNAIVTYYFEIEFDLTAAQVTNIDSLRLRHVIDDGAVFYLNGTEAPPRFNMDAGAVTGSTTTNTVVRDAVHEGPFELSTAALVPGTNRFAVEVHQQASNSSDIVFGAELSMTQSTVLVADAPLLISEISGTGDAVFRIEIANTSGTALAAGGFVLASRGATDESYTLPAPISIGGNDFLVLDEATLGFRPSDGDRLFLFTPGQQSLVHAARPDDLPRAWSAKHGKLLVPEAATFGLPNTFAINSDVVINEIMYHFREDPGTQGSGPVVDTVELIPIDANWRYNESGAGLAAGWQTSAHLVDGVNWFSGPALLGFEFGNLPEPILTPLADPFGTSIITYYFEEEFSLTAEQLAGSVSLELWHVIDDGAVFYINGAEVERFNMPGGVISPSTLADTLVRDAVYEGPFILPTGNLVVGKNRLSVEVHQDNPTNTDIVFGLALDAVFELAPSANPQPIVERDEEWVELFNKGTEEVDLTGWSIDGSVDLAFPADTKIPAGDFLLVAKDAAALTAKYPALAGKVIGDFRNRLNNGNGLIRLEDAVENPVDEVHYHEGGRWPELADGNGSSLELRDPDADNGSPGAWAASEESGKEGWQVITYRDNGGQSYGLTNWNEFRLGMLRGGEVLIDDVSVVRDPDGAAQELIQNGNFSSGSNTWRILGNHRHSSVIPEPGNAGNQVLHLVARGATDTRHNHLETTFLNNTAISTAQVYEVSFRARWLAGSNQVNTRCYYQRLARTTTLERPENCGTPGAANSRWESNIGPTFSNLRHDPPVPAANAPIKIRADLADPDGLGNFTLKARYSEGAVTDFNFTVDAAGHGEGTLPGAAAGTVIQFWVEGDDGLGASSMAPAAGQDSRALIQVEDGQGSALPLQEMRLIMLSSELSFMLQSLNLMSNERIGGTAISNGKAITYDVGVRLRGSGAGRARDGTSVRSFSISFPDDQLYRGVHGSIGADRSARAPVGRRPDEIYIKHMFNHAGVPCMYDDLVHMIGPSTTYTGIAMLQMARYGSLFASTQFENGDKGSVMNLDITYDPTSSIGGVEGFKPPVPFTHIGTDIRDLGESKEGYRTSFEIRTGRRRDDYASLMDFCQTMSLPTAELEAQIEEVMDVDEWMRYTALTLLCGIGDTFVTGGLRHNIRMYAPGGQGQVVVLPWDNDFVFSSGRSSSMLPGGGNLRRVVDIPRFRRLYWGHVHHLVNTTFNAGYMNDWLAHYGQVMGANLSGQASYISARGNHALNQLPASVSFSVTTSGGGDFSVNDTVAVLEGQGWINVREFRLAGSAVPLSLEWLDGNTWRVEVPLLPGPNPIDLEVYDFSGDLIQSANMTITSTVTEPQPVDFLRITELNFNPNGSDDTEFVELKNIGTIPLELEGVQFVDGILFAVSQSVVLNPGAFALVVRDQVAFSALYGPGLPVLGEYQPDNLSNDGERIELRDSSGNIIHDFNFSDAWYSAADGGGYSLVVLDENANTVDWNTAAGWRLSGDPGGNPNANNAFFSAQIEGWQRDHFTVEELGMPAISDPLSDANGDGTVNLLKYALGLDPWIQTPPEFLPSAEVVNNRLRLLVRRRKNAVDLQIAAEFGSDLVSWSAVEVPLGVPIDHGDGTETVVFEDSEAATAKRFGRMRVTLSSP
jgi:hypothetical protein